MLEILILPLLAIACIHVYVQQYILQGFILNEIWCRDIKIEKAQERDWDVTLAKTLNTLLHISILARAKVKHWHKEAIAIHLCLGKFFNNLSTNYYN